MSGPSQAPDHGASAATAAPSADNLATAGAAHTISGRLSVQYQDPRSGRDTSAFAHFDWSARAGAIHVQLTDPLGQSLAVIDAAPGSARLTLSNGQQFSGATPEELTRQALGWTLPLSGLDAWLDGRSAHQTAVTTAADGVGELDEDGWRIRFTADPGAPPRRIDASFTGDGQTVSLRIVIDERGPA